MNDRYAGSTRTSHIGRTRSYLMAMLVCLLGLAVQVFSTKCLIKIIGIRFRRTALGPSYFTF
jgi:hypothetical protein